MSATLRIEEPRKLDAIVNLLARRLPDWGYRQTAAEESGLPGAQYSGDARTGWRTLVREASERGRVVELVRAAAAQALDDPELARLATGIELGRVDVASPVEKAAPFVALGGLGAAGLAVSVGVVGVIWVASSLLGSGPVEVPLAPAPIAAPQPVPVVAAVAEPAPVAHAEPTGGSIPTEVQPPGQPEPQPEPEPARVLPVPPPNANWTLEEKARMGPGRCSSPEGQVVGYAFYDMKKPARRMTEWKLSRDLNVRSEYPSKKNGWDVQGTEVVCVLLEGSTIEIHPSAPPMRIEGGAWWIPVIGGAARGPSSR